MNPPSRIVTDPPHRLSPDSPLGKGAPVGSGGAAASAVAPVSHIPAASGPESPYSAAHRPVKLGRQWLPVQQQHGTWALGECVCGQTRAQVSLGMAVRWMRAHAEAMA